MPTQRAVFLVSLALIATAFLVGTVTAQESARITNADELDAVRDDLDGDYVLAEDIDLSDDNFEPIGDREETFTGRFDGDGNVITGLNVVRTRSDGVGLFGAVGRGGVVTDVGLEGVNVEGGGNVGGIVGLNRGNVTYSYVEGDVSGEDSNVGGVVGWNRGVVRLSYSKADVTGEIQVGGVAGSTDGGGTVSRTYAVGRVSATALSGGIVGKLGDANQLEMHESVLRDSYWNTGTTGQTEAYGNMRMGEGDVTVENVEGLPKDEMEGDDADESMTAFDFVGTWETTDEYPVLSRHTGIVPSDGTPLPGFGVFVAVLALVSFVALRAKTA